MSAFVVHYDPSGSPLNADIFKGAMDRLSHRGPDGQDVFIGGQCAMGHWHFWTTPEEQGERQPLKLKDLSCRLVFDGRLDNRDDLFQKLSIPPDVASATSDAALVLQAYRVWKEQCVGHFVGEFALVLYDETAQTLFCARDQLGDRTLFYTWTGSQLLIASEPWSAQAAQGSVDLDEQMIAHYFYIHASQDGHTFFKDVRELMPAHRMLVQAEGPRLERYWQLDPHRKIHYQTEQEYIDHFYSLLEQSVRCRMRATTPVSVLMSGGMDSTSVTCLAANMSSQPLTTVSFTYRNLPGADESKYIDAIAERWQTRSIKLICDESWPFQHEDQWARNPNRPTYNVYWLLNDRAYKCAHEEGARVMLTGMHGDDLYDKRLNWLADLLRDGKWIDAFRETILCLRKAGWRRTWQAGYLQAVVKIILNVFGVRINKDSPERPEWLMLESWQMLQETGINDFMNDYKMAGAWIAERCTDEIFYASLHSVELRNPYRDRRLAEFIVSIPAYLLFHDCMAKYILRTAMQTLMPDMVRLRTERTSFQPLFLRGLEQEQGHLLERFRNLKISRAWHTFVKRDWLTRQWETKTANDQKAMLLPWLCLSFEAWHQRKLSVGFESSV